MQDQTLEHRPFIRRRRELILNDIKNRREDIFNRTRQLLTQSQFVNDNNSQFLEQSAIMQAIGCKQLIILEQYGQQLKYKQPQSQKQQIKHINKHYSNHINKPNPKQQYYKNFQFPQWLTQIPQDIHNYYFSLRPVGERVLVHLLRRRMLIISMYGVVLDSIVVNKSQYANCIFEGYYLKESGIINSDNVNSISDSNNSNLFTNNTQNNNNNNTFATKTNPSLQQPKQRRLLLISDLLVWKQNPMTCSEFEFRIMWLLINFNQQIINTIMPNNTNNKSNESNKSSNSNTKNNNNNGIYKNNNTNQIELAVKLLPYSKVSAQNVRLQWEQRRSTCRYKTDGILFYQKDEYYIHGANPAVLFWQQPLIVSNISNNIVEQVNSNDNTTRRVQQDKHTKIASKLAMKSQQSSSSSLIFQQQSNNNNNTNQQQQQQQICVNQLNSLVISQQPTKNNSSNQQHFYGEFITDSSTLFTLDQVPIKKFHQHQQSHRKFINQVKLKYGDKCIVKFTFAQLKEEHQYDKMIEQDYIMDTLNTKTKQYAPFELINFKIISIHDINYKIPDCLSKLLWKNNLRKGMKMVDYQTLIKGIHQFERQSNMECEKEQINDKELQ